MSKKVMIVGAGVGQIPILKICLARKYDVFVVSIPGNYPCFKLTDNIRYADITDKEAVLKIAVEEKIDAVLSDQNDMAVPTVAYVAQKLGLRGIGYETALKFTNKFLMREAAKQAGINVPRFAKAKTFNEAEAFANENGFPLIIKPVDGWSSRGVHKINSMSELAECFNDSLSCSIEKSVIIEQFITGREYLADGFAMDGEYINLDLGVKEYFDVPNIFVSSMCMFSSSPTVTDRVEKMVLDANERLVRGLGLNFGITHAEYLYSQSDDKVYLVEVAARGGGVYLSSHITPEATGFNSNKALVDYVVEGKKYIPSKNELDKKVSAWKCFSFPEGEIVSISPAKEVEKIDGVYMVDLSKVYVGMKTERLKNDNGKFGPILISGNSREQCYDVLEKVKNTFKIKIKTTDGIKDLIW